MKGKNIITNIPNPKPLTRCMKLAAMVRMNMSMYVVSIFLFFYPVLRLSEFLVCEQFGKAGNLFQTQKFVF